MFRKKHSIVRRRLLSGLTIVALMTTSGFALADDNRICDMRGSWYGYLETIQVHLMSTVHGAGLSKGSYVLEVPGLDASALGAVKVSSFRGTWERIDNRSFAFTLVGYAVDVSGQTSVIVKISGTNVMATDCNTMVINNTNEFFSAAQDPFGDEQPAYGYERALEHTASRMRVDPPADPL